MQGYALATIEDGLVVVDDEGRQLLHLKRRENGLLDPKVHRLMRDREGALWGWRKNNGLSRVEFPSGVNYF